MLEGNVIQPAMLKCASTLATDRKLRFCVEYITLSAMTIRDTYPSPRIDECTSTLRDATTFSTTDCSIGYWQIEIPEADRDRATFSSHQGLFRFIRMLFRLNSAPGSFQRGVNIVLSGVMLRLALTYLKNITVYSKSGTEHPVPVRTLLTLLPNARVALRLSKCPLFDCTVSHLWHTIQPRKWALCSRTARQSASLCSRRPK